MYRRESEKYEPGSIGTMFGRKRAQEPHYNPYDKKQKLSEDESEKNDEEKIKELKELYLS